MKQRNTLFVGLLLAGAALASTASAGDYDRDVNAAISNLSSDEPAAAREAYKSALEKYRDARGKSFECLFTQLSNADPARDINSDWDSCMAGFNTAFGHARQDLLLAYKDAHPDGDYSPDKIGLKDFMNAEEAFVNNFGAKRYFPEARSLILGGLKIAQDSMADFDKRWDELTRADAELESKKASEENQGLEKLKAAVKTLRDQLTGDPTGTVPTELQVALELSRHTDAFWQLVSTEKGTVFTVFRTTREAAQKVYGERIRPEVSETFLQAARSTAEGNSALTSREDYRTFSGKALDLLSGYVKQERALSDEFLKRNKGRFLDTVEAEVIERLGGGPTMNQLLQDMELQQKTLEELLTRYEAGVSSSGATDSVKSTWRDFKDRVLASSPYNRWVQGFEDYQKSLDDSGLKR